MNVAELGQRVTSNQFFEKVPTIEWGLYGDTIERIQRLKREKNAIIVAHNYQTPEIFHGVADITGDSLTLAQCAAGTDAQRIILCGVHFMAETTKLMNPGKRVLIPDLHAGCSLASSITAADIRALRKQHPGVPVVAYVNTTADVKAEVDICCTSANAVAVVESLGVGRVIFLPDEYLGKWVATQTNVEIILWNGHCEVHERFSAEDIRNFKLSMPGVPVVAHPECSPGVLSESDFVGSTSAMIQYVKKHRPVKLALITECSMSDNIQVEIPETELVRPCNLCPHMRRITLGKIEQSLLNDTYEVTLDPMLATRARGAVERMLKVGRREIV